MFDIVIIGAGPAGIFSAYELIKNKPDLKIMVVDKGKSIDKRTCPMRSNSNISCINCKPCGIMSGFGGAGTFSDCKLTLSSKGGVGGSLADYVGVDIADNYISKVDDILASFDDKEKREIIGLSDNSNIRKIKNLCEDNNVILAYAPTKHYGTDGTFKIMTKLQSYIEKQGVYFLFQNDVKEISKMTINANCFCVRIANKNTENKYIYAKHIIAAPGRSGNQWLGKIVKKSFDSIKVLHNKIDIGVRVEVPADAVKFLTDNLYDMKLSYVDPKTGDKIRTFCTNPRGYVSEEHYGKNAVVNGHSYSDIKSNKTNFALLVTLNNEHLDSEYLQKYIEICNNITNNKLIYQNFYDFTDDTLKYHFIKENKELTFNTAIKGDLKLILPTRVTQLIDRFINILCNAFYEKDTVRDVALYGIEAKFYSDKIEMNNKLETNIKNFYCAGDGAGITRGISQSGAMGLIIADRILSEYKI